MVAVAVGPNEVKAREEDLEGRAAIDEEGGMVGAILVLKEKRSVGRLEVKKTPSFCAR